MRRSGKLLITITDVLIHESFHIKS